MVESVSPSELEPPPLSPNPLLPVAWQRDRNVPHSTAAREIAYARALTDQFMRAAPAVVLSHANAKDGHPRSASALIDALPKLDIAAIAVGVPTARTLFDAAPALTDTES